MDKGLVDKCLEHTKYSGDAIYPYSWLRIMRNHDLITWLWWVNDNICDQLSIDNYNTVQVKLRIATGMLNKLESLTDMEKTEIHTNLTTNVQNAFFLRLERELPF